LTDKQRIIAGRYELGALIGRGGMADVYEGTDTRLGRVVAIKLLKADLANDPNFEARFRQEAQASARMAHPTIVRIYDAGEEESVDYNGHPVRRPYIVMEFVKGVVLRDLLHQRRLTVEEAVNYTDGVLTALSTSHNSGIIHRDIKSANVMISDAGTVKVMDFGIARAISDSSSTQAHTVGIMGTAQYFSPEQARGENVDARTDLYSTGVLLYEMLAGRPPFKGETAVSVAYQHVSEAVTPPSAHNKMISPELDAVVMQALAKDRNSRFQTADEFREHLAAAVNAMQLHAAAQHALTGSLPIVTPEDQNQVLAEAAAEYPVTPVAEEPAPAHSPLSDFEALLRGETTVMPANEPEPELPAPIYADPFETPEPGHQAPSNVEYVYTDQVPQAPEVVAAPPAPVFAANSAKQQESLDRAETSLLTNPFEALGIDAPEPSINTTSQAIVDAEGRRPRRANGAPSPRLLWGIGSGLGVVIVGVLIWILAMGGFPNLVVTPGGNAGVAVPSLANVSYSNGYNTLTNDKLLINKVYQASDTVPVDTIISTDPPAGTKVSENTLITVYVSSGKGQVTVPDLTNLTEDAANTAITNAKLVLGTINQANSATVPQGQVISSDPVKGTQIAAGTSINLVVSNGQVLVPDVRNLDVTSATAQLKAPDVALSVSVTTAQPCSGTLGTTVLSQSILPGLTPAGSAIVLTVACNP
jgi:serine/threonine protein kinase/beta-lactam-binding protein with PASTA domain